MHEDLDITNHGQKPVRFNLELALRSDFADIFEVKANHIIRRGRITTSWDGQTQRLDTTYRNRDFRRELIVQAERCGSPAVFANGRISFEVALEPGAAWHACLLYELVDGTRHFPPPDDCTALAADAHASRPRDEWAAELLTVETANQVFNSLYAQAIDDMSAMRLPLAETGTADFVPAAGLPWFVALFGRDSLIVSLQNAIVCSTFALGTLDALAHWQADARDDWRDAEPGKIPHELRLGELAHFKMIPHTPYYGTADATPLYPIVLHQAWRATGEKALAGTPPRHRRALPRLDRRIWRPRRRWLPGVPDPLAGRLREPIVEGFGRSAGQSRRQPGQGTEGAVRTARLRL